MKKLKIFALLTMLCSSTISGFSTNADSLRCSPNPFVANTTISYYTATRDTLTINIYNRWGTIIYQPFIDSIINQGSYSFMFFGGSYPDGVYLVQLKNKSVNLRVMNITKSANAGILQLKNPVDLRIYPNPANTSFEITTNNEQIIKKVELYTIEGILLIQQTFSESKIKINTSLLPTGMYVIEVQTKEKRMFQKLIISH